MQSRNAFLPFPLGSLRSPPESLIAIIDTRERKPKGQGALPIEFPPNMPEQQQPDRRPKQSVYSQWLKSPEIGQCRPLLATGNQPRPVLATGNYTLPPWPVRPPRPVRSRATTLASWPVTPPATNHQLRQPSRELATAATPPPAHSPPGTSSCPLCLSQIARYTRGLPQDSIFTGPVR